MLDYFVWGGAVGVCFYGVFSQGFFKDAMVCACVVAYPINFVFIKLKKKNENTTTTKTTKR
jgi:hypothetical protein